MRLLLIIAVVTVSAYAGWAQVPHEVQSYIQTHLRGWTIADTTDYDRLWWSFYDKKQVPFFVMIGINHSFIHQITDDFKVGVKNLKYGLAIEPAGQIDVLEPKEATLILRSNAITLMEMEDRSRIYYWSDRAIKTFLCKRSGL
jgi:hypothetical protein